MSQEAYEEWHERVKAAGRRFIEATEPYRDKDFKIMRAYLSLWWDFLGLRKRRCLKAMEEARAIEKRVMEEAGAVYEAELAEALRMFKKRMGGSTKEWLIEKGEGE